MQAGMPAQIDISGTLAGTTSSASVSAMTSATVTPGAVSIRVALAVGKADHRHLGHDKVDRPRPMSAAGCTS